LPLAQLTRGKDTFPSQAQHGVQGLEDLTTGDLGGSVAPVLEDDGHFADLPSPSLAPIEHFDQKGVAIREDLIQLDGFQDLPAIAAETACAVMSLEAQDQASKGISCSAQDIPPLST
jgi:hypothetical protein